MEREATSRHAYAPKKALMISAPNQDWCNIILFYPTKEKPTHNFTLFGFRSGFVTLQDKIQASKCSNCNTFHPGFCRKAKTCANCGISSITKEATNGTRPTSGDMDDHLAKDRRLPRGLEVRGAHSEDRDWRHVQPEGGKDPLFYKSDS